MRRAAILSLVIFQVVVLAYMAANREYIVRYGQVIHLRTAPVDPRAVFRGDFVRLNYELSRVDKSLTDLSESAHKKGQKVYAELSPIAGDLYGITHLSDTEPTSGVYMRGRVVRDYPSSVVYVKYGIEQYFVQQGTGIDIETRRGNHDTLQIPMEVAVALSANGTAVTKDYRWSRLGIQLEVIRTPRRDAGADTDEVEQPLSAKLKLTMKNVLETPLALVNAGSNCAFEIVSASGNPRDFVSIYENCADIVPDTGDIVALAPEQEQVYEIGLSEPRWHMTGSGKSGEIGVIAPWQRFRIIYRAPDLATLNTLSGDAAVWKGYLPSRAFTGSGTID